MSQKVKGSKGLRDKRSKGQKVQRIKGSSVQGESFIPSSFRLLDFLTFRSYGFLSTVFALQLLIGCSFLQLSTPNSQLYSDMVLIPAGSFIMGSDASDGIIGFEIGADEYPKRDVRVKAFYMDRFEVNEKDYYRYLNVTGKKKYPGYWEEAGRLDRYPPEYENDPVSDVDWFDADDYCRWVGKRLPTEIEWEKAARGLDGRLWPWGNDYVIGRANANESSKDIKAPRGQRHGYGWKAPVGSHPEDRSPYGVFDMAGNVKEWTSSSYASYPGNTIKPIERTDRFKVLRGGSYMTPGTFSRTAVRVAVLPTMGPRESDGWHSDYTYGFRCAKDQ